MSKDNQTNDFVTREEFLASISEIKEDVKNVTNVIQQFTAEFAKNFSMVERDVHITDYKNKNEIYRVLDKKEMKDSTTRRWFISLGVTILLVLFGGVNVYVLSAISSSSTNLKLEFLSSLHEIEKNITKNMLKEKHDRKMLELRLEQLKNNIKKGN